MLATDLRPTLFLAQLPNLFAGNISIVHGVVRIKPDVSWARNLPGWMQCASPLNASRAGQGDLFLVGGAFNASRPEAADVRALSGCCRRDAGAGLLAAAGQGALRWAVSAPSW